MTGQPCGCGCGQPTKNSRAKYASLRCGAIARHQRERTAGVSAFMAGQAAAKARRKALLDALPPRPCGCGCGRALQPGQDRYASRACTQRALWRNPQAQAKRKEALRKAKAQQRIRLWLKRANANGVLESLRKRIDFDLLTREDQRTLMVTLSRLIQRMYQEGYKHGRTVVLQRLRSGAPLDDLEVA